MADRQNVILNADIVAMGAKTNMLTAHDVDNMRQLADQLMETDDPVRPAIMQFATQYEVLKRDPYGLQKQGEALEWELDTDRGRAKPSRRERRDIDG